MKRLRESQLEYDLLDQPPRKRVRYSFAAILALAALGCLLLPQAAEFWSHVGLGGTHPQAAAQERPAKQNGPAKLPAAQAFLIQVPLPIEGTVDAQVKNRIQLVLRTLEKADAARGALKRPVLILEFRGSDGNAGQSSSFGRALELAQFLTSDELSRVRTVAYLPQSVKGHAVLPVLACEEIVIAKNAEFGEAGHLANSVTDAVKVNYEEIAKRRRTVPPAIARGLVDNSVHVLQVTVGTPQGNTVRYETAEGLKALRDQQANIIREDTVFQPGEPHKLVGIQMRDKYGFAAHRAANRRELAAALDLPANSIQEHLAPEEGWQPILVSLEGPVTQRVVNWIEKSLEGHVRRDDFNLLVLRINSSGGDPAQSLRLARKLVDLGEKYHSVAVVEQRALGDAAIIAWAADELLVDDRADLGGPGEAVMDEDTVEPLRDSLKDLAERRDRDWSLALALVDPRVEVFPYTTEDGQTRYLCAAEVQELPNPDTFQRSGEALNTRRGIDGGKAVEIGFASGLVQSLEEVRSRYGVQELRPVRPNWALEFIEWLADPRLAGLLLFIAWFALMIEMSTPGVGAPGFVAALCFLLYFWSQFLHGTAGWLEILLFLAGAMFVAVEIFVLPGFGVFGIGGGVMIVLSIILASQTFILPGNDYQMRQVPVSLMMVAAGASGAVVSLYVIRRFLPHTPYFNRMLLKPPEGEELEALSRRESLALFDHLMGKRGVTTTALVPSGKARFGDDLVDVISDGELIPKGTPVYVAEVMGARVLVKPLS
jgi:membrane-bound ClpP family serine protease